MQMSSREQVGIPSVRPWRWRSGMEREGEGAGALLLQDACGLRGEKGVWLLSSSPTLKTNMALPHWHGSCMLQREALAQTSGGGDGRTGSSRVTTTPSLSYTSLSISLSPERLRERDGRKKSEKSNAQRGRDGMGWNPNKSNFQTRKERKRKEKRKQARRS